MTKKNSKKWIIIDKTLNVDPATSGMLDIFGTGSIYYLGEAKYRVKNLLTNEEREVELKATYVIGDEIHL